jgi:hypothetical protein
MPSTTSPKPILFQGIGNSTTFRLFHLEKIFGLGIGRKNSHLTLRVDGKTEPPTPEQFLWVIPTGSLEGYH